uniref:Uncharacterized protein n=1 Tax=Picea glauca TaxID=3330 RepID=A0A124GN70_PICGL|nr:hypothetical protein ABT39_MTgene4883 [Picea glauca]
MGYYFLTSFLRLGDISYLVYRKAKERSYYFEKKKKGREGWVINILMDTLFHTLFI